LTVPTTVSVGANATLGGSGNLSAGGTITVDGTIAPGISVGTLTLGGAGALALNGTMTAEIDSAVSADQLVAGTVNLGAASHLDLQLDAAYKNTADRPDTFQLVNAASVSGNFLTIGGVVFPTTNPDAPAGNLAVAVFYPGDQINGVPVAAGTVQAMVTLPADFTGDYFTDGNDLLVYNANKNASGKTWATGDSDGDGFCDGNDLLQYNANKNQELVAAAGASAAFAAPPAGNTSVFTYDAVSGELTIEVLTGIAEAAILVETAETNVVAAYPLNLPNVPSLNLEWDYQWLNNQMQFQDTTTALDVVAGETVLLAHLVPGLGPGDFGVAKYGFEGGIGETVVNVIPEPGTLLLLVIGFGSLLLWRRR
jgi:hypothetical protein